MSGLRDVALRCEALKIAYRQSKDGFVVSFVIHPNEMPKPLANAAIGSRWMLALVEIGEDEKPLAQAEAEPTTRKRLVQQCAIACADPRFQMFLFEHQMLDMASDHPEVNEANATVAVRLICGVTSRRDIIEGTPAADKWKDLYAKYLVWKDHPELVPA